ncbi:MAG: acetyl-CoA carboxylase, carboxyltransferase subunit beta [Gammaproteobacteria bacterium]|nr:acetyl-CoA carboxylase, carboxyltransferase subunit beta [Gammaproteobacteria bacterium]MCY4218466.1 acetyl-CoA carboxylase, carboxyltransferase subunit beta [Gammaproteobacteria bacterium]MCY4274597.1 acetyl-CoA carboxylase, carboxyltransferase subunit beta [Gammaproteobacteria bacterium]
MNWFDKIIPPKINPALRLRKRKGVPEGLWTNCTKCQTMLYVSDLIKSLQVCPKCNNHMQISAKERIEHLLDANSIEWLGEHLKPVDFLKFKDQKRYKDRLAEAQKTSDSSEALKVAVGTLHGTPITVSAFEFNFMGGSMGTVVGQRFVLAAEASLEREQPLVCFASSGGARMQEGLYSLLQMSKTSAVIARLAKKQIPFISVLTNPTMGGVSASLAMLGDLIIAEPNALIGFAGPRVIDQTVRASLPEGFQRSEFLLQHGAIDMIIDRRNMRIEITNLLIKLGFGIRNYEEVPNHFNREHQ